MATPLKFPKPGLHKQVAAQVSHDGSHTSGGSMLLKLIGVVIATFLIASFEPVRPWAIPFFIIALGTAFAFESLRVVPQQNAWVVERVGKFHEVLEPGLNVIIPFIDRIAYRHSLKEVPLDVAEQV